LAVLKSISWIYSQTGMPRTAKIIWRPHVNERVKSYIIERKTLEDEEWEELAYVDGRLSAEYIDKELKDNYIYKYRIKVETYDDIISSSSKVVKVITKALPKTINNIKTTKNLPKKIKITWNKSRNKDFKFYYLYRSKSSNGSYELIATLYNPLFVDEIKNDGESYFYRVSSIDKDGLESEHERTSVQGMTLSKPQAPAIVKAHLVDGNIELIWNKVDKRTKGYIIVKKTKTGWFNESREDIKGIKKKRFTDSNIMDDTLYTYTVYAIDKHSIISEPSIAVKFKTQESKGIIKAPVKKLLKEKKDVKKEKIKIEKNFDSIQPMSDLNVNEF